jgi:hypothetical protein
MIFAGLGIVFIETDLESAMEMVFDTPSMRAPFRP